MPLFSLPLNTAAVITSVKSESSDLLSFLSSRKITIGTKVEVKRRLDFDNSLEVKVRSRQPIHISEQVANAIQVNPL
jgi:DtxR family Mn-dependent transcriptional regulator